MNKEGFSIFYTDDDKDDRDTFVDAVNEISKALQILTQGNGNELIDLLKTPPPYPDIIFLDLNMPLKNGYDVLTEIKQSAGIKDVPIIIFSTSDDPHAILKSRQLGASLYITKPWSFSALKKVIQYSISINWETFSPSDQEFVYRAN